ncbi:peptidoglycan DD-metalloendopeptidase family protein [Algoriphagus sediminis]|uniref:Peptidoglycan DD-metalloendopeptidase family protein n=1 Tax=Algoriphagus sediminis TaxID=3057113 RepID=A0ABT7YCL0_9BACT|nr:peptidoglycan DD-metalloendopeptidase family protein [Algoriphagus sediminis]MDN3204261.1 peptidoglycan DD-metalloendopeptidase family protein [Algoriphagus sediminis]
MNWNEPLIFPIMGEDLTHENSLKMDFSPANEELKKVDLSSTEAFNRFVFGQLKSENKKFGLGGYLEKRAIYQRSDMFATKQEDFRNIHLGVDIWVEAGAEVFVPLDGEVVGVQDNKGFADYGPTIILKHDWEGKTLFSLYGHLSREDLKFLEVGQRVISGELLCHVGPYPENGDWPPHLHFQLMRDMEKNSGDYPGVCSEREKEHFSKNCPDPNLFLNSKVLD